MTARIQFPIDYIEPVFRPPSEAHSLILPVTNGCSWNKCIFCDMYTAPQKKFRARDEERVLEEIRQCGERLIVQRVFLADGDAMVLPTHRLLRILQAIREHMPEVHRVRSEEHTSELQSRPHLVCRLLLEKKNNTEKGCHAHFGINR